MLVPTTAEEAAAAFTCAPYRCRMAGTACRGRYERANAGKGAKKKNPARVAPVIGDLSCVGCEAGAARHRLLREDAAPQLPGELVAAVHELRGDAPRDERKDDVGTTSIPPEIERLLDRPDGICNSDVREHYKIKRAAARERLVAWVDGGLLERRGTSKHMRYVRPGSQAASETTAPPRARSESRRPEAMPDGASSPTAIAHGQVVAVGGRVQPGVTIEIDGRQFEVPVSAADARAWGLRLYQPVRLLLQVEAG